MGPVPEAIQKAGLPQELICDLTCPELVDSFEAATAALDLPSMVHISSGTRVPAGANYTIDEARLR